MLTRAGPNAAHGWHAMAGRSVSCSMSRRSEPASAAYSGCSGAAIVGRGGRHGGFAARGGARREHHRTAGGGHEAGASSEGVMRGEDRFSAVPAGQAAPVAENVTGTVWIYVSCIQHNFGPRAACGSRCGPAKPDPAWLR